MSIPFLCLYMKFVYYIFVILIFASYFDVDEQNRIIYGYNNEFEDYFLKYSF